LISESIQSNEKVKPKVRDERENNGGKRPGAGRIKGSLNKSTVEFRDYAKSYTNESIDRLVMIMRNSKDVWAVLAAIEHSTPCLRLYPLWFFSQGIFLIRIFRSDGVHHLDPLPGSILRWCQGCVAHDSQAAPGSPSQSGPCLG
jgi:hypothetical protein